MNRTRTVFLRWMVLGLLAFFVLVYIPSYVALSRRGFAEADASGWDGFYFFPPEDSDQWRFWNYTMVRIYYPLILIDNFIGTGRLIGAEPLWRMS